MVLANLNTKTYFSTGVMSPEQLRDWHVRHKVDVLNVSDRDQIEGARRAANYNFERPAAPPMTVTVGQEWHAHPDLVLVHTDRLWHGSDDARDSIIEGVHRFGGAAVVAHPWSRMTDTTLADQYARGVDGVELVNGVIYGGQGIIQTSQRAEPKRALLGVTDPKFGPNLYAVTLIPRAYASSPRRVATALRLGLTEVLYAVPGGAVSAAERSANPLQMMGLLPALRTLFETPRPRRVVWLVTMIAMLGLWWLSIRGVHTPRLGRGWARLLFWGSGFILAASPLGLQWQLRAAIGPIPVPAILLAVVPFAVVLLATSHHLALHEEARKEPSA
jgi:hypothetical protein